MKIFVTGSTGLLGSTLLRLAPKEIKLGASFNVNKIVPKLDCSYFYIDIRNKSLVKKCLSDFKPDVVIHTAAIASPDYCDKNKREATDVNVLGTKNIVEVSRELKSILVYINTNGIYDGKSPPYDEKKKPSPVDHYGKTKLIGENLVLKSEIPSIIVRLMTMYGWNNPNERQNPATWLLELVGRNKTSVNVVKDMFNNFLFVESAAEAIWRAVKLKKTGEAFNVAGKECINRYNFSQLTADVFELDKKMIYPVNSDYFKNFVVRPKNSCFLTKKMENVLKIKPLEIKKGLIKMRRKKVDENFWKTLQ